MDDKNSLTYDQVVADPEFHNLPIESRRKVLKSVDPDFRALPGPSQDKVLQRLVAPNSPTPPASGVSGSWDAPEWHPAPQPEGPELFGDSFSDGPVMQAIKGPLRSIKNTLMAPFSMTKAAFAPPNPIVDVIPPLPFGATDGSQVAANLINRMILNPAVALDQRADNEYAKGDLINSTQSRIESRLPIVGSMMEKARNRAAAGDSIGAFTEGLTDLYGPKAFGKVKTALSPMIPPTTMEIAGRTEPLTLGEATSNSHLLATQKALQTTSGQMQDFAQARNARLGNAMTDEVAGLQGNPNFETQGLMSQAAARGSASAAQAAQITNGIRSIPGRISPISDASIAGEQAQAALRGSKPLQAVTQAQNDLTALPNRISPVATAEAAGTQAQTAAAARIKAIGDSAKGKYEDVFGAADAAGAKGETANLIAGTKAVAENLQEAGVPVPPELQRILNLEDTVGLRNLKDLRSTLLSAVRRYRQDGILQPNSARLASDAAMKADEAIENGFRDSGLQDKIPLWRQANSEHKSALGLQNDSGLSRILDLPPEKIAVKLSSLSFDDLRDLQQHLTPEVFNGLVGQHLQGLISSASKNGSVSASSLVQKLNALGDERWNVLTKDAAGQPLGVADHVNQFRQRANDLQSLTQQNANSPLAKILNAPKEQVPSLLGKMSADELRSVKQNLPEPVWDALVRHHLQGTLRSAMTSDSQGFRADALQSSLGQVDPASLRELLSDSKGNIRPNLAQHFQSLRGHSNALSQLDKGSILDRLQATPPERAFRVFDNASLQDIRTLKQSLPNEAVEGLFKNYLADAIRNSIEGAAEPTMAATEVASKVKLPLGQIQGGDVRSVLDKLNSDGRLAELTKGNPALQQHISNIYQIGDAMQKLEQSGALNAKMGSILDNMGIHVPLPLRIPGVSLLMSKMMLNPKQSLAFYKVLREAPGSMGEKAAIANLLNAPAENQQLQPSLLNPFPVVGR